MNIKLEHITKSHLPKKKYDAHLTVDGRAKIVPFGAVGYSDYTQHQDSQRKQRYLQRHQKREDWTNPLTPGFYSRWLLWNQPTLQGSEKSLRSRFGL